jgi:hypothetical protein
VVGAQVAAVLHGLNIVVHVAEESAALDALPLLLASALRVAFAVASAATLPVAHALEIGMREIVHGHGFLVIGQSQGIFAISSWVVLNLQAFVLFHPFAVNLDAGVLRRCIRVVREGVSLEDIVVFVAGMVLRQSAGEVREYVVRAGFFRNLVALVARDRDCADRALELVCVALSRGKAFVRVANLGLVKLFRQAFPAAIVSIRVDSSSARGRPAAAGFAAWAPGTEGIRHAVNRAGRRVTRAGLLEFVVGALQGHALWIGSERWNSNSARSRLRATSTRR